MRPHRPTRAVILLAIVSLAAAAFAGSASALSFPAHAHSATAESAKKKKPKKLRSKKTIALPAAGEVTVARVVVTLPKKKKKKKKRTPALAGRTATGATASAKKFKLPKIVIAKKKALPASVSILANLKRTKNKRRFIGHILIANREQTSTPSRVLAGPNQGPHATFFVDVPRDPRAPRMGTTYTVDTGGPFPTDPDCTRFLDTTGAPNPFNAPGPGRVPFPGRSHPTPFFQICDDVVDPVGNPDPAVFNCDVRVEVFDPFEGIARGSCNGDYDSVVVSNEHDSIQCFSPTMQCQIQNGIAYFTAAGAPVQAGSETALHTRGASMRTGTKTELTYTNSANKTSTTVTVTNP